MAANNYVPDYVPSNLPWYERDGLMTWYNQRKCEEFLKNPGENFQKTKITNFDIIHRKPRGEKLPESLLKKYQTIAEERTKCYPKKDQDNFLSHASRTKGPDIYLEKMLLLITLQNVNNKTFLF